MRSRALFLVGLLALAACASEDPSPAPDASEARPAEVASTLAPRTPEEVRSFYRALEMPGPVVHDADGAVCESYGVEPVPFFFVVAKDGTIAARGPYTPAAVRRTLYEVLGLDDEAAAEEPETGAG